MSDYIPLTANHYLLFVTDLCRLAYGKVTVRLLSDIGLSSPRKGITRPSDCAFLKAYDAAKVNLGNKIEAYRLTLSKEEQLIWENSPNFNDTLCAAVPEAKLFTLVNQFFVDFYKVDELERDKIETAFSEYLHCFVKGASFSVLRKHKDTVLQSQDEKMDAELLSRDFCDYVGGADTDDENFHLWQNAGGTA